MGERLKILMSIILLLGMFGMAQASVLIGGSTRNGDFNANPGAIVSFADTDFWENIGTGDQTEECTKDNLGYDNTQNATIGQLAERHLSQDTDHVISAGDVFDISYVWADKWNFEDASDQIAVSLFVTDDNTISGVRTDLVVDLSGLVTVNGAYEEVNHDAIYTAVAADAGKQLFVEIQGLDGGANAVDSWARLDNFELDLAISVDAYNPTPASGQTDVALDTDLKWDNPADYVADKFVLEFREGDPNWLNTVNTTTVVDPVVDLDLDGDLNTTEAAVPFALTNLTTYYWRVISTDANGGSPIDHVGSTWSFTTVTANATLDTDPVSQTVPAGTTVVLSVAGMNITNYQWYKDGVVISDGGSITGSGTDTLTITGTQIADEGSYHCVVDNALNQPDTSASAFIMTERLAGWWKLDGDLTDSVQDEVVGAPTHDGGSIDPSFVGSAKDTGGISFSSDPNELVIISDSDDFNFYPQGYTVSAWIKTTQASWGAYVSKQSLSRDQGFILTYAPGGNAVHTLRSSFGDLNSGVQINDEVWHLVTGTYDATTGEGIVYVDGLFAQSATSAGVVEANADPLIFGAELSDGSAAAYVGLLDDVRIWSYVLDPVDVATLYVDFNPGDTICVEYPALDMTGPAGVPDCKVDIYDFAEFASSWLECGLIPASNCSN